MVKTNSAKDQKFMSIKFTSIFNFLFHETQLHLILCISVMVKAKLC